MTAPTAIPAFAPAESPSLSAAVSVGLEVGLGEPTVTGDVALVDVGSTLKVEAIVGDPVEVLVVDGDVEEDEGTAARVNVGDRETRFD